MFGVVSRKKINKWGFGFFNNQDKLKASVLFYFSLLWLEMVNVSTANFGFQVMNYFGVLTFERKIKVESIHLLCVWEVGVHDIKRDYSYIG